MHTASERRETSLGVDAPGPSEPATHAPPPRWRRGVDLAGWIGAVVLLALFAGDRLVGLDTPLEADAATQRILIATLDVGALLRHAYPDPRHPPLGYLLLHVVTLWTTSAYAMRLVSVVGSLAALAATYGFAREAVGPLRGWVPLVALGLCTPFLVQSRFVSDLPLFVTLAMAGSWVALRALRTPDRRWLVALVVADAALLWAYYMGVLVVVAHAVTGIACARGRRLAWAVAMLAVACLGAPELGGLVSGVVADLDVRQVAHAFPAQVWGDRTGGELLEAVVALVGPAGGAGVRATFGALLVVGAGALVVDRRRPVALMCGIVLAGAALTAGAGAAQVRLWPYYFTFALPFAWTLAVAGTATGSGGWRRVTGLVVAGGLAVPLIPTVQRYVTELPSLLTPELFFRYDRVAAYVRAHPAGEPSMTGADRTPVGRVVAEPHHALTMLLYYVFDDAPARYRACQPPTATSGPACLGPDGGVQTLVLASTLQGDWQHDDVARLLRVPLPYWFVRTDVFPNPVMDAHLEAACTEHLRTDALTLFRCEDAAGTIEDPAGYEATPPSP